MLAFLLTLMVVVSLIIAVNTSDTHIFSSCITDGTEAAILLCFSLAGAMAFWGGIMKIAEKSGVTRAVTHLLKKPVSLLFAGLKNDEILSLISLNISANLLGIGSASLPFALAAMKHLKETDGCKGRDTAVFIILNTASLQIIPFTTAAMRSRHGTASPWDIMPASLMTSAASLTAGLIASYIFFSRRQGNDN